MEVNGKSYRLRASMTQVITAI